MMHHFLPRRQMFFILPHGLIIHLRSRSPSGEVIAEKTAGEPMDGKTEMLFSASGRWFSTQPAILLCFTWQSQMEVGRYPHSQPIRYFVLFPFAKTFIPHYSSHYLEQRATRDGAVSPVVIILLSFTTARAEAQVMLRKGMLSWQWPGAEPI